MNSRKKMFFVVIIATCIPALITAQNNRDYIKQNIQKWGQCRNVAITKTKGNVALAANGAAWQGLSSSLSQALQKLSDGGQYIVDVHITEGGSWLAIGSGGMILWEGIDSRLENEIRRLAQRNDQIISVTFNDSGDWIVISNKSYLSSDTDIHQWLVANANEYGSLRSACMTDDAIIVAFQKGVAARGNYPQSCFDALRKTSMSVFRIKISGTSWFFADESGRNYSYTM